MSAIPEISPALPPTAIGRDFPVDGRWIGMTPFGRAIRINLRGYAALTVGWVEGIELNILGAVAGVDFRRPALGWRNRCSIRNGRPSNEILRILAPVTL
jgi:hypothetical protein